jgi:hypothetical protein
MQTDRGQIKTVSTPKNILTMLLSVPGSRIVKYRLANTNAAGIMSRLRSMMDENLL